MAALRVVQRGGVNFEVYAKSIHVTCKHGATLIFYGRETDDKDIDALCKLIDMGAALQATQLQDALAGTSLFDVRQ